MFAVALLMATQVSPRSAVNGDVVIKRPDTKREELEAQLEESILRLHVLQYAKRAARSSRARDCFLFVFCFGALRLGSDVLAVARRQYASAKNALLDTDLDASTRADVKGALRSSNCHGACLWHVALTIRLFFFFISLQHRCVVVVALHGSCSSCNRYGEGVDCRDQDAPSQESYARGAFGACFCFRCCFSFASRCARCRVRRPVSLS